MRETFTTISEVHDYIRTAIEAGHEARAEDYDVEGIAHAISEFDRANQEFVLIVDTDEVWNIVAAHRYEQEFPTSIHVDERGVFAAWVDGVRITDLERITCDRSDPASNASWYLDGNPLWDGVFWCHDAATLAVVPSELGTVVDRRTGRVGTWFDL